jgi:phage terminase small subunit
MKGGAVMDDREELFVKYFLKCGESYPAAIEAGYKRNTAAYAYEWITETLTNPNVKRHLPYKPYLRAAIDAELEKLKQPAIATAEEVLIYLSSVMRKKSESEVLARDELGAERLILKHPDEKEAIKAAELLGKRYGLWEKKQDEGTEAQDDGFLDAIRGEVAEVWQQE